MSKYVNHLDTKEFQATVNTYKTHIEEFERILELVKDTCDELSSNWEGKGAKAFERDSGLVQLNLKDIREIMYDFRDALVDAEAEYMRMDMKAAKAINT